MVRETTTVRIGPASVFSLVVVVCLAVMAVLSITTANASHAEADAQARFTTAAYANDAQAADALARVDEALASASAAGATAQEAAQLAAAAAGATAPANAAADGAAVDMRFEAEGGRTLSVRIEVQDDLTYDIVRWTTGVDRDEATEGGALWTGE